jgi:hypothetical protein
MKTRMIFLLRRIFGEWIFISRDPHVSKKNLFIRAYLVDEKDNFRGGKKGKIKTYAKVE